MRPKTYLAAATGASGKRRGCGETVFLRAGVCAARCFICAKALAGKKLSNDFAGDAVPLLCAISVADIHTAKASGNRFPT
jgi:hypothetical protein